MTLTERIVRLRARAEATMVDRCRLVGDPDATTTDEYDELALTLTPPPDDPAVLWPTDATPEIAPGVPEPGRCLVNYRNLGRGGDDRGPSLEYSVALPWSIDPLPRPGQWVEITAAAVLPGVDGMTLTVVDVERGSLAPYVRVRAHRITERERAPGG